MVCENQKKLRNDKVKIAYNLLGMEDLIELREEMQEFNKVSRELEKCSQCDGNCECENNKEELNGKLRK